MFYSTKLQWLVTSQSVSLVSNSTFIWNASPINQSQYHPNNASNKDSKQEENHKCLINSCLYTLTTNTTEFKTVSVSPQQRGREMETNFTRLWYYLSWACKSFWFSKEISKRDSNKKWHVWSQKNLVPHSCNKQYW